jgi:tetratricopeptide (TPR) repeat protein
MRELFRGMLPRVAMSLAIALAGAHVVCAQQDTGQARDRLDLVLAEGNAAVGAGRYELAIASFQKVLENLDPDSREAGDLHLRMGETYRRKGDAEAAIASLIRASELLPDQPAVVGTLALVLDSCGRKAEAEQAYRATLQLDSDNAIAMNNLAFLLAERGEDLDHAWGYARRAMELMPEDVDMIDTAGWVQYKRQEMDAALGLFAKAVGKEPGNDGYRQHLLLALAGKTERTAAMEELQGLLVSDSSSAGAEKVLELLQAVRSSIR